ncbi:MAG: hypothetical protein HZA88_18955 [Verrucomicrobia bacterium]|nr:hypothetical protein [Verrucomicrobiota bacterium]
MKPTFPLSGLFPEVCGQKTCHRHSNPILGLASRNPASDRGAQLAAIADPQRAIGIQQSNPATFAKPGYFRTDTTTDFGLILHCVSPFTRLSNLSNFAVDTHFI